MSYKYITMKIGKKEEYDWENCISAYIGAYQVP